MLRSTPRNSVIMLAMVLLGSLLLTGPAAVKAGIFDANNEVTYKEYWVHHTQFTGGCNDDGTPTSPFGSFYFEPHTLAKCPKTVEFTLPDDFSNAAKIELYIDLWRNYDTQAAMFTINDGEAHHPPVGTEWGRTPYVAEIDKSEFKPGLNKMTFWGDKQYHVHDIGIRIYHTGANPLVAGPGSDVTPPDGNLTSIADDDNSVGPGAGGTLMVNDEELTLTANISADTAYVEFHAWYEGYDEDADGIFRDWHNSGRNNWWPGGREEKDTGGTINHVGTVKPKNGATTATVKWNVAHITNQPLIKFKIRVVDAAGNVREAAGGESANFKMMRAAPVNAFTIHDFVDTSLHMDGRRPDSAEYKFTMPNSVVTGFTQAYLVGAYWRSPNFSINDSGATSVSAPDWSLGIKSFTKGFLKAGQNRITYLYSGGTGQFIEEPGPMFVLRRADAIADTTAPAVSKQSPLPNATGVDVKSAIVAHVGDELYGVDWMTVVMTVNDENVTAKAKLQGLMGDYRLVYSPQGGKLAFSTEYNVKIEACDIKGNCMQPVTYKFTTAAPDTTAPTISDIVVTPLPIGANITWTTNESATSRVDYGKTQSYELGFEEDLVLKTSHSLEIRGLQPETLYNFRIKGTDEQGNTGQSGNQSFTTLEFGELLSNDFNSCVLDETIWQVVDPKGDLTLFMNGQQLELSVPAGVSHDFATNPPYTPSVARVMQIASDEDFSIEVKFDSLVDLLGQAQGLLIMEDADTYVRVNFENAPSGRILFARFVKDGALVTSKTTTFAADVPLPSQLKVERTGDSFNWSYFQNGVWKKGVGAPQTMDMTPLEVGFFVGNSGSAGAQPAHKAVVDYFFNSAAPIVPEDSAPMNINVIKVGSGTVTKVPDKTPYVCGDEVIVSATPEPGWSFIEWSGDATGASPTIPITIDAPKTLTATFTQDQYLLNIVYDNDGVGGEGNVVMKSPAQETYVYGDVVQLTAVPQPGWKFVEWSGGVAGTSPTISITMLETETVTARFEQEQYVIDLSTVHNGLGEGGTVGKSPLKTTYVYGDEVTLTATLNPGWTFGGWSGGAISAELQTQITVTGDMAVIATFDQIHYEINVDVIGGGGEVTLDPQKDFYLYNEVVSLVADGGACWAFDQWGGDLSGDNPVEVVAVTDDVNATATFTENTYSLTVNKIGPGNVTVSPPGTTHTCGEEVTLQAVPAPNFYFGGWSGDLIGAENPLTFVIEKDTVVTANFTDNPPPTVEPIADQTIKPGELVTLQIEATDPEGEPLTLSANGLPPGATFTPNPDGTGVFTWWSGISQVGEYTITFIATDGTSQGSTTVVITVAGTGIGLPIIIRP